MNEDVPWHMLKPLKQIRFPRRVIFVAVEPWIRKIEHKLSDHTFRLAAASCVTFDKGVCQERTEALFSTKEELWDTIDKWSLHDRVTWLVAYNLGYCLTLSAYWALLDRGVRQYRWSVLADPPTIVLDSRGRKRLRMACLFNYYRSSLSELEQQIGRNGLSMCGNELATAIPVERCRRRLEITETMICSLMKELATSGLSGWASTAGSISWKIWRTSCYDVPVWIHKHEDAWRLERAALFGGHLWMSRKGFVPGPIVAADVNSLYPWVMKEFPHPVKFVRQVQSPTLAVLKRALMGWWCIARVTVTPDWPLPWRPSEQRVEYSVEKRQYVLCGISLAYAVAAGHVRRVHELSLYEPDVPFRSFVDTLWRRRVSAKQRQDKVAASVWKLLLCSLSGKFGQTLGQWEDDPHLLCPIHWGEFYHSDRMSRHPIRCRSIAGHGQRCSSIRPARDSFTALTCSIAEVGRFRLRELALRAGLHEVIYADTDCLHLLEKGLDRLAIAGEMDEQALGKLKIACQGADAYYWGHKFYRIGNKIVSNVLHYSDSDVSDGMYLQASKDNIGSMIRNVNLDHVPIRERNVTVANGPPVKTVWHDGDFFDGQT